MAADVTPGQTCDRNRAWVLAPRLRRWVPSLVGLPSPVHERSGSGPQRPTGYKLMRSLPHAASRPSRGITSARSARANTSRPRTSRRAPPPSRPLRAASGGGLRPALTAAALARNRQPSAPAGKRLLTPQAPYKRMSARRREGYGGPARSARLSAAKAGSDIRDPASRFARRDRGPPPPLPGSAEGGADASATRRVWRRRQRPAPVGRRRRSACIRVTIPRSTKALSAH